MDSLFDLWIDFHNMLFKNVLNNEQMMESLSNQWIHFHSHFFQH